jgi:hypothetical protein
VAAPAGYFERMRTTADTEESSAQGRITAWKSGFGMALGNPLLGAGAGNFPVGFGRLNGGRWMTAHSIYFLLLGELGFPGLFLLIGLIWANLSANVSLQREVRRLDPERAARMANLLSCGSASMVGFAIAGAFLSAAYYPHLLPTHLRDLRSAGGVAARGPAGACRRTCGEPAACDCRTSCARAGAGCDLSGVAPESGRGARRAATGGTVRIVHILRMVHAVPISRHVQDPTAC